MLPSDHRMRRRAEFTQAVRRGRRAGRHSIVVHLLCRDEVPAERLASERPAAQRPVSQPPTEPPALVGFIVARPVGNAVVRNKVRRRLRHLVTGHLDRLPRGSLLVVRAKPGAATARHDELAADIESALGRLLRPRSKGQR